MNTKTTLEEKDDKSSSKDTSDENSDAEKPSENKENSSEEKPSEEQEKPEMIRVGSTITQGRLIYSTDGYYRMLQSAAWGRYLTSVENPDGVVLSDYEKNGIKLIDDFPKLPADLWSRWVALCFYMCPNTKSKMASTFHDRQLEVQVCLLRDAETKTKWKIVVPKQIVSGVSVKAELAENIDIATGERYTQFPPQGWLYAGTSHSHNTMGAFFSSTDNKSEISCPGFHAVIGNIDHEKKQYTYASSIVLRKMRKNIELDEVVDVTAMEKEFHADVLEYIDTVVSANKKLYEKEQKPTKDDGKPLMPWAELEGFTGGAGDFFSDGKEEVDIDEIDDLDDLDYFDLDEDKHFPYHEEVSSLVDSVLSQGYTVTDLLLSLRKAKEEFDTFSSTAITSDDDLTDPFNTPKQW
jgi:hypothetical protein